ncbi:MAG: hypothetical protein ACFCD0_12610 [Gemmataceae bacterium]
MRCLARSFVVAGCLALGLGIPARAEAQFNTATLTPPNPTESQFYFDGQQWRLRPQLPQQQFGQQPNDVNPNQVLPPTNGGAAPTPILPGNGGARPLPPVPDDNNLQPFNPAPVTPNPRVTTRPNIVQPTMPPQTIQPVPTKTCYLVYYRGCTFEQWRAYGPFVDAQSASSYACRMNRVGWFTRVVAVQR